MPTFTSEPQWYVIQTLANKEDSVKRYLDSYAKTEEMEDYLLEVLTPTELVSEVKNGKKRSRKRKFYPNYVFIRAHLYDDDNVLINKPWYFIRQAEGVIGFVGGERPVALKQSEIDTILQKMKDSEGKETPKITFTKGEEVKIIDGPFLNLMGQIENIDYEKGKLLLSVNIFGRFTPVELQFSQVQRAADAT